MNKRITLIMVMLLLTASTGLANLTDGLMAYYPFDGDASDLSGNANHATVYGAQLTEDRFGRADHAYLFDGVDDTIEAPHSASLDITGPITVSCWMKAHDTYWRSGLVIKAPDYDPSVGYHLRTVYDKAHFGLYYSVGSTHNGGGVSSDTLVNDNVWHLVTGTYDGSEIRMYVDGQSETLTPYSIGYESNTAALQIGHYYYPYSDLWGPGHEGRHDVSLNGAIDEVRIYNRALTQSEITELYNEEPGSELLNVALQANGGIATADSEGTYLGIKHYAYLSIDGKYANQNDAWCNSWNMPAWLQVEFNQVYKISRIGIAWDQHNQTFSVSLSEDGTNWTVVVPSRQSNTNAMTNPSGYGNTNREPEIFNITPRDAKYIRLDITATSAPPTHIFKATVGELQAYAVQEPEPPGITTLSGAIYEDKDEDGQYTTGEGIMGAIISTDQGPQIFPTSYDGGYSIPFIKPGVTQLEVRIVGQLYHVESIDIEEGENTHDIAIQVSVISQAYECADADTVCLRSIVGLVPVISIPIQVLSLENDICEIRRLADKGDVDEAYGTGVKTVVTALASQIPLVNVVFEAINCLEAQMSERYENGLKPEDLDILARGLSDGSTLIVTMSPVDIRVLNSNGNVMELNSEGLTENQLGCPGWIFKLNGHRELAVILDADGDYVVQIVGRPEAGTGSTFGLQLMRQTSGGSQIIFSYTNVPITSQGTATVAISDGIKPILEVDVDGDGSIDLNLLPDSLAVEVIPQLPPSKRNNPGRTVPVKFSARKPERVDPAMPFVHDEDLEIRIYDSAQPGIVLQASTYGDTSTNYRIDDMDELYITNFKTKKEAAEYTVEIWRPNVPFMVGIFSFQTIASHANQKNTNDTYDDKGIDVEEAVTFTLFEVSEIINKLGPKSFKNEESAIELANEIEAVFAMLDEGLFVEALDVLENDILQRADGCVHNGEPDEDDWVTSRKGQALVYPLVTEAIELLESLK